MFWGLSFSSFQVCTCTHVHIYAHIPVQVCVHRHREDGSWCQEYPSVTLHLTHWVKPRITDMADIARQLAPAIFCLHLLNLEVQAAATFTRHSHEFWWWESSPLVWGEPLMLSPLLKQQFSCFPFGRCATCRKLQLHSSLIPKAPASISWTAEGERLYPPIVPQVSSKVFKW